MVKPFDADIAISIAAENVRNLLETNNKIAGAQPVTLLKRYSGMFSVVFRGYRNGTVA